MHFGQEVTGVAKREDGRFDVTTAGGLQFDAGAIVIAGGVGSFQPRRLGVEGIEAFEGHQVFYRVKAASEFHGARLVIFGGGDSALDWTLALADKAASLTLVHRRAEFRAAPASVAKMQELVAAGRMRFIEGTAQSLQSVGDRLTSIAVKDAAGAMHELPADAVLAFFGLAPKLGPIAEWGLALEKKALLVDTEKFQTSIPGIFAVGDINTYPGKKKLILSGFHEAALAAFGIQHYLYPAKRQFLQYTTTSPVMHQRLGVGEGG
jgi:thioredoxin reductase (NADPH)